MYVFDLLLSRGLPALGLRPKTGSEAKQRRLDFGDGPSDQLSFSGLKKSYMNHLDTMWCSTIVSSKQPVDGIA